AAAQCAPRATRSASASEIVDVKRAHAGARPAPANVRRCRQGAESHAAEERSPRDITETARFDLRFGWALSHSPTVAYIRATAVSPPYEHTPLRRAPPRGLRGVHDPA